MIRLSDFVATTRLNRPDFTRNDSRKVDEKSPAGSGPGNLRGMRMGSNGSSQGGLVHSDEVFVTGGGHPGFA